MVNFRVKGDWSKTNSFFDRALGLVNLSSFDKYGKEGVNALKRMTPVDSGATKDGWSYKIERSKDKVTIYWNNSNLSSSGTPVAIYIQYGHATVDGDFINGRDFVNPAMKNTFEEIAEMAWKEVTRD